MNAPSVSAVVRFGVEVVAGEATEAVEVDAFGVDFVDFVLAMMGKGRETGGRQEKAGRKCEVSFGYGS